MKKLSLILLILFTVSLVKADKNNIYDHELNLTNGKKLELSSLKGKAFMIVNIATRCGYTGQLDDLEKLYKKYKDKGFNIVGVPSNDFGGQTPEGNKEVAKFCRLKYGATFPIAEKTVVTGSDKPALFKELTQSGGEISWNFEKFLISKNGTLLKRFKSGDEPFSKSLVQAVEQALK